MNIYDVITDDPIKVEQFDAACVSLSKSRYILAESKIKAVLKIVATSSLLQNALASALKGFDYGFEAKLFAESGTLPSGKKLAAFLFCLFADIDSGEVSLGDFLEKFYGSDMNAAYFSFCSEMVVPFMKETDELLRGNHSEISKVKECVKVLMEKINGSEDFTAGEKNDLCYMCDSLLGNIADKNAAKAIIIGLRRSLRKDVFDPYLDYLSAYANA